MRFLASFALLAVTASIAAASAQPQLSKAQQAPPDTAVTHWSAIAAAPLMALPAAPAVVQMAMVHGAIYDAVNSIDGGHRPYLGNVAADPTDSLDAAVAAAAYNVLLGVLATPPATLAGDYASALAAIPNGPAKTGGIAVGEAAAAAMLAARAHDGRFGPFRFTPSTDVGRWRPEPATQVGDPNAWLKDVTPFGIDNPSKYASHGPYDLTSKQYAREFNEVKALGRATGSSRTQAQTDIANFWAVNPPRLWSSIVRTLATQEQLSTVDAARYYALTYFAMADTLISVWTDKARWSFWRPITAIHDAANDGNPDTSPDSTWTPFLATPPYPDHPSGHVSVATAVTIAAQRFFGTDDISFDATNALLLGGTGTRSFTSLSQARDEVIDARVLQGIHFRHADEDGERIGHGVTTWVMSHLLKPAGED
jgi:hypothetical protein